MSKNKRFSITSAERYSLALYELASENNILLQVENQCSSILNLILSSEDFSNLIKDHSSNIDLIHGRIVYSNKTFIEEGEIICKGESELTSEYPRLSFVCSIDIQNKKELFKKLSISKKINKEPVSLYIEGSLNLLNRKINFKNINIDKDKILEEDKIYFKEIFEKILFDEGFFKIFNKKKIKNFILEIN